MPPTHGGTGDEPLVAPAVLDVERMGEFPGGRCVEQLKPPGARVKRAGEDSHQAHQQVLETGGFGFRVVEPKKRLGLSFAYLVIRLIQRQSRDQLQLLPRRREAAGEGMIEQRAEFAENLADLTQREVQPGQAAAMVFHLLTELLERAQPAGGGRRDAAECANLQGIVRTLAQKTAELPVETVGLSAI